ncbi:MAG TPA: hypothetical protein VGD62_09715 [Acidobacteriaceae bacterium]
MLGRPQMAVPVLVGCWVLLYVVPGVVSATVPRTAWVWLMMEGAAHGLGNLEASARIVTVLVTCIAVAGAGLRLWGRAGWQQAGLVAVCVPLSIVLPAVGAVCFVAAAVLVAGLCRVRGSGGVAERLWRRLVRESFPVLSAGCFVFLSWQYNAQWLTRGLLVAGGLALVARATLPQVRAGA